jgi:tetratricopeptide (TPR) repeat protein
MGAGGETGTRWLGKEGTPMRTLTRLIITRMIVSRVGRWTLTVILLLLGAVSLISYPDIVATQSATDGTTALVTGIVFGVFGLLMLGFSLRMDQFQRRAQRARKASKQQADALRASGQLMPIPALPPTPTGIAPEVFDQIEAYAERMAALPWGQNPTVSEAEAPAIFNRTVAQTTTVRGDWSALSGPINTFVSLPQPWAWVGAAHIMWRLSYISGMIHGAVGLQRGLRFIASTQVTYKDQPDALVIRAVLLTGTNSPRWLELSAETIERLRQVAPDHPRLASAESALYERRGEYEAALAATDRVIANAPSPEEAFSARSSRADLLDKMNRLDEALAAFQDVLAAQPNDAWNWHNVSLVLIKLGRLDEALEANTRALALMDFRNARVTRERIMKLQAERAASPEEAAPQADAAPPAQPQG